MVFVEVEHCGDAFFGHRHPAHVSNSSDCRWQK